jgi:hypothetical protein
VVDLVIEHDLEELRGKPHAFRYLRRINDPLESMPQEALSRVRFRVRPYPATRPGAGPVPIVHPFFAADFAPKSMRQLLSTALDAAMKLAGTDLGNIQLLDRAGSLRIRAHHGFPRSFLGFFDMVRIGDASACGKALREQRQFFVEDVQQNPIFAGTVSGGVLLEAGVVAVVSSPIIDAAGAPLGVVSTHFRQRMSPDAVNLDAQRVAAERLGDWLEKDVSHPG